MDRLRGRFNRFMPTLTLYTKPDCTLCDDARAALERVRARMPFELDVVDISVDGRLAERYGERIPVVLVDGEEAWEYVVDERELERRLGARAEATR